MKNCRCPRLNIYILVLSLFIMIFISGYGNNVAFTDTLTINENIEKVILPQDTSKRLGKKVESEKVVELEEVEVVATKIKMVMKGDTIIYNADAFMLVQGSMLDKLMELLPGVRINDKGQITVNGEYISSLLINGKDFFSGNPGVALMNLPAYTVNQVKVYRKEGRDAYLRERTVADRKKDPLVMDVHLKKRFLGSYLCNLDVAGGTTKRYSLRNFIAGFDNETNFGVFGNLNNVGMISDPSQNGNIWDDEDQIFGNNVYRSAGISFSNYGNHQKRVIFVNADGKYNTLRTNSRIITKGYLPSDFNYSSQSSIRSQNGEGRLSLDASLGLQLKNIYSSSMANIIYDNVTGNFANITQKNSGTDIPEFFKLKEESFINSYQSISKNHSDGILINGSQYFSIRMPYNADILSLNFYGSYSQNRNLDWNVSNNISKDTLSILNDLKKSPTHNTDVTVSGIYEHKFKCGLTINPSYEFNYRQYHNERKLYNFLPDSILTEIPVVTDTLTLISDLKQSYIANTITLQQRVKFNANFNILNTLFNFSLPITWKKEKMKDSRTESLTRNSWSFDPSIMISWKYLRFQYSIQTQTPTAQQLLDFTDNSNLLTVRKGNPYLKNSKQHYTSVSFSHIFPRREMNLNIQTSYSITKDGIANAVSFNPETGVNTIMAYNVDGNRKIWSNLEFGLNFGSRRKFRLDAEIGMSNNRSVAFSSTGSLEFEKSIVSSNHFDPTIKLSYINENFNISGRVYGKGLWTSGNLESFEKTDIFDGGAGITGWLKLPFGLLIETGLSYSIERGYSESDMNRNQLFWKASVQKFFGKEGRWTIRLDGFDILGQLSGLTRSVNPQGITETSRSLIGRYILLHIQYNFNYVRTNKNSSL